MLTFVNKLSADLEMDYAGQLGWVPYAAQGIVNQGLLHKGQHQRVLCDPRMLPYRGAYVCAAIFYTTVVPFFTHLDHRSKIAICDKLLFTTYTK